MTSSNKGILLALGAYGAWGFLPIYWKALHHVPAMQIIGHRILWSSLMLTAFILLMRQWKSLRASITPRVIGIYIVAAILVCANWLIYIWAVNADFIVETSLGYFINPLLSVLLGVIFFRERLRLWQWIPIGLAALGVVYLTIIYGSLPWIALALAFSFGLYGLVKKTAPLGAVHGMTLETGILLLPALAYLFYEESLGQGAFLHSGVTTDLFLIGGGLVTSIPMIMFSSATQRIPLSLVGILQYIAPTLQFLIGVLIYKEPFTSVQFIGFAIVWIALILYAAEGLYTRRAQLTVAAAD
jgi:chloramphenicol-sensitive protein RarD